MNNNQIIDDPSIYGSRGQSWSLNFVKYMKFIVTHPSYDGMPDAVGEDGKIQWEAPSNRSSGKYQFTHNKRKKWWEQKARSLGINPTQDKWISKTAKYIHPTKEKPCKKCGKFMRIQYVYLGKTLIKRFERLFPQLIIEEDNTIIDVVYKAYHISSPILFTNLEQLLKTKDFIIINDIHSIDDLINWLEKIYIPSEPSILSPGVMSNAPDRFDGFHSFNRCCRGKADKGRNKDNLKSYGADRRVFEYWSEGDWIAANKLMGLVKKELSHEKNEDGGLGSPTADHIGPISLGFCHRPEFKLLSKSANSAKNNRMTLSDVKYLISCEEQGIKVVSWYAQPLWDNMKYIISTEEEAQRLSKLLRDNQRNFMFILSLIFQERKYSFLIYLLELSYAEFDIEFENLHSKKFITTYTKIIKTKKTTKYVNEQKARRIRIGFESLTSYINKENRHNFIITNKRIEYEFNNLIIKLNSINDIQYNEYIEQILISKKEEQLREFADSYPTNKIKPFEEIKYDIQNIMKEISHILSSMWNDSRYTRD